jgi:hypothetical protein
MKIVFVHDRSAGKAFGAEDEIQCLTDGRLSGIVPTDKKRMPREVNLSLGYAAVVLERQSPNAHGLYFALGWLKKAPGKCGRSPNNL